GFGNKERSWNDFVPKRSRKQREMFLRWREQLAVVLNEGLAEAGHAERVDHRSYAERGIKLTPRPKLFRKREDAPTDRRPHVRERADRHATITRENGNRIIREPQVALQLLTERKATFTRGDLEGLLRSHTGDEAQYRAAWAAVRTCPELVECGLDRNGFERFTTRDMKQQEEALVRYAQFAGQQATHRVPDALVEQAIQLAPIKLSQDQADAVRAIACGGDFVIVEGPAGTGKSTMLQVTRQALEAGGYRVHGASLAGKAADGLETSASIPSRTLHSWQASWRRQVRCLDERDVFVVDEAGMVGTRQLAAVMHEVRAAGAKLVLVGDTRQLQPIEAGAPMRLLRQRFGAAKLTKIRRQEQEWMQEQTRAFADERARDALDAYHARGHILQVADAGAARQRVVALWEEHRKAHPTETSLMVAFRRADVRELNQLARSKRKRALELGTDHTFRTSRGVRRFAEGDRIVFLRNDYGMGVRNGTLGTIDIIDGQRVMVRLDRALPDGSHELTFDVGQYNAVDHGYAHTIHKGQGDTVDRTFALASRHLDAFATNVILTRHRKDAQLVYSAEEFASFERLRHCLAREEVTPMALELQAGDHQADEHQLDVTASHPAATLRRTQFSDAFVLGLSADEQDDLIATLRAQASAPQVSRAQMLDRSPTVIAARVDLREADRALRQARYALTVFEREHPLQAAAGTAAHRARAEALRSAERAEEQARLRLRAVRGDRRVLARAAAATRKHNAAIRAVQDRHTRVRTLVENARLEAQLVEHARIANQAAGAMRFRPASSHDKGRRYEVVQLAEEHGQRLVLLRDADGGPFVIGNERSVAPEGRLEVGMTVVFGASLEHERARERGRAR
ncbi:MAG TPA: AAA family ATPase, partial [Polyangiales bacterium]|nr:AAA family ATPase [Polyangiales bacterium]